MTRHATLYRMKLSDHECPYGLLAKRMLDDAGFDVDEHLLTTREEVDAFKAEHGVDTTPQVFIDGKRIGGSEELADFLQKAGA
jgi:glutaredoxin 3